VNLVGRLKEGVTREQAQADANAIAQGMQEQFSCAQIRVRFCPWSVVRGPLFSVGLAMG
jgi:hypothetical protein